MAKQFDGTTCVLCNIRPSTTTGEHVWPEWFLERHPEGSGPFSLVVDGEPVLNRDGHLRTQTSVLRAKLPACDSCNSILNTRFEQPAKLLVRQMLDSKVDRSFESAQVRTLALWLLKTWLLLAHSQTRYSDPCFTPEAWEGVPADLYGWMVTGDDPPAGLSLWISRARNRADKADAMPRLALPTVVSPDTYVRFRAKRVGIADLDINLAYHPRWEIRLPASAVSGNVCAVHKFT